MSGSVRAQDGLPKSRPPRTWGAGRAHIVALLQSRWYPRVARLQAAVTALTHDFFRAEGCQPALTPVTTGTVSSPIGLGSDSLPVSAQVDGRRVFLADSMQFHLEL